MPFRIKEAIDTIRKEYYVPGGEKVTVLFEGTEDEYEEVSAICEDEEVSKEINLELSPQYLDNARDILKEIKKNFSNVKPILDDIIGEGSGDKNIKKKLNKVTEALDDVVPICVFGNYSVGKSTFINALIGNEILPSGGDPVTAKIYQLSKSAQNDRIVISFSCEEENIELRFDNNGVKVKGNCDHSLVEEIQQRIEGFEIKELFTMASSALDMINSYECKDEKEAVIGDVVSIEVPFSKNGIIGQSDYKFVIFDTPGSNSNSNRDHAQVLKRAMEGFSNGIPVWVSQYDAIDSIDNANLCDNIYAIDALDKRFTMIVINKADTAELPENGWNAKEIKKFKEFDAIEKMYASGIYFVSSVMGLGAKNNGKFVNHFLKKTYKEKRESFSNPEEEEFYQTLYKYNIMPPQIKENAIVYSLENENLVYANSGLLCIEKEMETFAGKYSAYNKCQMVYTFLNSVIEKANQNIEDKKEMLSGYRKETQSKLDEKKKKLKDEIDKGAKQKENIYVKESKIFVKNYVRQNLYFSLSLEELNEQDGKYTEENVKKNHFSSYEKDYKDSNERKWNNLKLGIHEFVKGNGKFEEVIQTFRTDSAETKENKKSRDSVKREIDITTSDTLLCDVRKEYRDHMSEAKNKIDAVVEEKWMDYSEDFKKQMIAIIGESKELASEERDKILSQIRDYDPLRLDEDIFIKKDFLRFASEKLNNRKLVDSYNKKIARDIMRLAKEQNNECQGSFQRWAERLKDLIEQNITEYNPELREIAHKIALLSEDIRKQERNQDTIQNSFEMVGDMMDWKTLE